MTDTIPDQPFDRTHYQLLKQAIGALAGVCDGAEKRDDEGFDGQDTRAGHLLAFLPLEAWPPSAFHRAWKWTHKYHRQLALMQIDCSALAEPPVCEGEDRQIALQPQEDGFFVVFPYNLEVIDVFRAIPGSRLHTVPIGKGNKLSFRYRTVRQVPGAGAALLAFAERYGFALGPGVTQRAAEEAGVAEESPREECRVVVEGDAFALYFPRIDGLNQEVRAIVGRQPTMAGGFHWLIPATPQAIAALIGFLQRHPQFFVSPEARERLDLSPVVPS